MSSRFPCCPGRLHSRWGATTVIIILITIKVHAHLMHALRRIGLKRLPRKDKNFRPYIAVGVRSYGYNMHELVPHPSFH